MIDLPLDQLRGGMIMYQEVLVVDWVAIEPTRDNFLMGASTNILVLNSCQGLATFFLCMGDYIKSDTNL
jgi:hypothetical protein